MSSLAEQFSFKREDDLHQVNYKTVMQNQQNNKPLIKSAELNKNYSIKHFHRADKIYSLICRKHKIVIPKLLKKQVVEWYHNALCHPGEILIELSIAQHFDRKIYVKRYVRFALNARPVTF